MWDVDFSFRMNLTICEVSVERSTIRWKYVFMDVKKTFKVAQGSIQYIPRNMHTVFALLCFVVVIHWLIFPVSIRLTSLALWQSNDCPSASKATLMNMDKYFMWIHYERLHNHNKAKHNKAVCKFLGIYCKTTLKKIKIINKCEWANEQLSPQNSVQDRTTMFCCLGISKNCCDLMSVIELRQSVHRIWTMGKIISETSPWGPFDQHGLT